MFGIIFFMLRPVTNYCFLFIFYDAHFRASPAAANRLLTMRSKNGSAPLPSGPTQNDWSLRGDTNVTQIWGRNASAQTRHGQHTCLRPSHLGPPVSDHGCFVFLRVSTGAGGVVQLSRLTAHLTICAPAMLGFYARALKARRASNAARLSPAFLRGTGGGHFLTHAIASV